MLPTAVAREARDNVLDYLRTTFAINDERLDEALIEFLGGPDGLLRGPYLDVRLPFRKADGDRAIDLLDVAPAFPPYAHQLQAFERLSSKGGRRPQHTLVTTGTGSGKTECFLYPVLDHCRRARAAGKTGVKAILLYPMNALATDQARRIAKELHDNPLLEGVTAGLYVGGEGIHKRSTRDDLVDDRRELRRNPPDILLTNYRMLDFLLLRPEDGVLWKGNGPDTLRYLVLDELHTYDGAQGSDVACLIRRLKARLEIPDRTLCCVGTSATIGSGSAASKAHLAEFASSIFGESVGVGALVVEDRESPHDTFPNPPTVNRAPTDADHQRLEPVGREPDEWLRDQAELWLGDRGLIDDRIALGVALATHRYLRDLIGHLAGQPQRTDEIADRLASKEAWLRGFSDAQRVRALDSFVALISWARSGLGEGVSRTEIPFLTVQVQLWMRELSGLLRTMSETPDFRWRSALGGSEAQLRDGSADGDEPAALPMVRCRECGTVGFGSAQRDGERYLLDHRRENSVGRRWMERSASCRFVVLGHDDAEADGLFSPPKDYVCPFCLARVDEEGCSCRGEAKTPPIAVRILQETVQDKQSGPPRFKELCPDCGSEGSLMFLGSRAPSLLSVALSHLFQSEYNEDKKLIAFVDGVQDASHRAGFFGSRAYRFNLRTLIQGVVDEQDAPIALSDLADSLFEAGASRLGGKERAIPTLVPEDLRQHPDYEAFLESEGKGEHLALQGWLRSRLSLEAVFEYGFGVRAGRSLEASGCSTAFVDPARLASASAEVELFLVNEAVLGGASIDADRVRTFLHAIVNRLRLRGGVHNALLGGYVRSGGARYMLSRQKSRIGPLFAPDAVLPRFLQAKAPEGAKRSAFDAYVPRKGGQNWYADLAARIFGVHRADPGVVGAVEQSLRSLVRAGVLRREETEQGQREIFGLDPNALFVTGQVTRLICGRCRDKLTVPTDHGPHFTGTPCTRYRCTGQYGGPSSPDDTFYTRIFRSGRLAPIFPDEHTGLLERTKREGVEKRFIDGTFPEGPNMLVATPTLEMGIDIGTLSAVLLCSVPPTTSNYLQRVGRAGRSTGNALALTMALARPHDLFFHDEPSEMLDGQVDPPGVFLDAPEMLKRQFVAYVMDDWAKVTDPTDGIPRQVTSILAGSSGMLDSIEQHYASNGERLRDGFVDGFRAGTLSERSTEDLRVFAGGDNVPGAFRAAFAAVREDRNRLRNLNERARNRVKELEESGDASSQAVQEDLEEARRARAMLSKLYAEAGAKYPLQVLTDFGVLPNYAFPEPGVELESVIGVRRGANIEYQSHSYRRPASAALRELAPSNTFYAEGRRVQIDEIDLGSASQPLIELWRFCSACPHSDRRVDASKAPEPNCPRCGDDSWADAENVRHVVHFLRSKSYRDRLQAAIADDGDDRVRERYDTLDLIDAGTAKGWGARVIASLPFGFELLRDLELVEVNFGLQEGGATIAGSPVNGRGFEVCRDCGRVRLGKQSSPIRHAATCRTKSGKAERIVPVHLYRRVRSEALRLLLPIASSELHVERASFLAALQLGLRLHFGGRAPHLQTKWTHEPAGDGRRNYIVLFDSVPGGTGTLGDLHRGNRLIEMFRKALRAMETCECDDGCYRCVYAYQLQRELECTSKRVAISLLREVVSREGELEEADSLSGVAIDDRLESELEDRFIRALMARARVVGSGEPTLENSERVWELRMGESRWKVLPQVSLGPADGVAIPTRPDFLIVPQSTQMGALPIAVYCDGFRYHVQPENAEARIHDDLAKRSAIAASGRYRTWSVTWDDVVAFEEGRARLKGALLDTAPSDSVLGLCKGWGVDVDREVAQTSSMDLLWMHLERASDDWISKQLAFLATAVLVRQRTLPGDWFEQCRTALLVSTGPMLDVPEPQPVAAGTSRLHGLLRSRAYAVLTSVAMAQLRGANAPAFDWTMRLFDTQSERSDPEFRDEWRRFLQAFNLIQFAASFTVTTTEGIDEGMLAEGAAAMMVADAPPPDLESERSVEADARWRDLGFLPDEIPFVDAVDQAVALTAEPSFEVFVGSRVVAQAALAWPPINLAVCGDQKDADALRQLGWTVEMLSSDPSQVAQQAQRLNS